MPDCKSGRSEAGDVSARRFRPAIEKMEPYVPGEQPRPGQRVIKLNTNENPYPPSPRVAQALRRAAATLHLYPQPRADAFIEAASKLYRLPTRMILAGNGSDELLAMLFRAALDAGDKVAYAKATYSLYDTLAEIQGARVAAISYPRDFALPAAALARAKARLTIVCNPNSPSGTLTPRATLEELARRLAPRLLVIDEAYVDFADENALGLVRSHSNVIVLRSLSKSFSLAGMRLGLGFAQPEIIDELLKVKDSYNLSRAAVAVGEAALSDLRSMRRNVARIRAARARAEQELRAFGFEVPPSSSNFVLARMPGRDLSGLAAKLRRRGILVRYFPVPSLRDALRISIGAPREMRALFDALGPLVRENIAR